MTCITARIIDQKPKPIGGRRDKYTRLADDYRKVRHEISVLRKLLAGYRFGHGKEVTSRAAQIIDAVAEERMVSAADILSESKVRPVAWARFVAYHELREGLGWSLPQIGTYFNRDHGTIFEGLRRYKGLVAAGKIIRGTKE